MISGILYNINNLSNYMVSVNYFYLQIIMITLQLYIFKLTYLTEMIFKENYSKGFNPSLK